MSAAALLGQLAVYAIVIAIGSYIVRQQYSALVQRRREQLEARRRIQEFKDNPPGPSGPRLVQRDPSPHCHRFSSGGF